MKSKYSSVEEMLRKEYGITPTSKHHSYDYLYRSIVKAIDEHGVEKYKEGVADGKFIESVKH